MMARQVLLAIRSMACLFTILMLCGSATAEVRRFLYASTPDGAQKEGRSGNGILVFDIDNGHKFVKRIEIPVFEDGLRGFTGNLKTHSVYFSTSNQRLGCFDLETEKVVWQQRYNVGCDRSSITLDGKKIYVPTGWWDSSDGSGLLVVDGTNGNLLKRIPIGPKAHNSIVTLDGKQVFIGTDVALTVLDTDTDEIIRTMTPVGEYGIFPFTLNSDNTIAYVCLGKHVGFDVVDVEAGEVLHRVMAGAEPIPHRTHGAALTPDESELWISDQKGQKLFIFDATVMPPEPKGHVDLSIGGHGWVAFSLDGQYAWSHAPDVFDAKSRKLVATLRDEHGQPFASSKFVEVHFEDGKVVQMGHEFGLGRR